MGVLMVGGPSVSSPVVGTFVAFAPSLVLSSSDLCRYIEPSAFVVVMCYLWVTYLGHRHVGSLFVSLLMSC
jgi:hypothetical protein